jgi:hypothetical protein
MLKGALPFPILPLSDMILRADHDEKVLGVIQRTLDLFDPSLARPNALEVRSRRTPFTI